MPDEKYYLRWRKKWEAELIANPGQRDAIQTKIDSIDNKLAVLRQQPQQSHSYEQKSELPKKQQRIDYIYKTIPTIQNKVLQYLGSVQSADRGQILTYLSQTVGKEYNITDNELAYHFKSFMANLENNRQITIRRGDFDTWSLKQQPQLLQVPDITFKTESKPMISDKGKAKILQIETTDVPTPINPNVAYDFMTALELITQSIMKKYDGWQTAYQIKYGALVFEIMRLTGDAHMEEIDKLFKDGTLVLYGRGNDTKNYTVFISDIYIAVNSALWPYIRAKSPNDFYEMQQMLHQFLPTLYSGFVTVEDTQGWRHLKMAVETSNTVYKKAFYINYKRPINSKIAVAILLHRFNNIYVCESDNKEYRTMVFFMHDLTKEDLKMLSIYK